MALIKLGGLAQDVRGSQNGLTFSRNKGGAYVRQKVSPVQPRTPRQLAVRATFSNLSKHWSGTLTSTQRSAWTAFAAANPLTNVFGDSIVTSGMAAYMGLNQVLANIGVSAISNPPVDKTVPVLATVTGLTAASGTPAVALTTAAQAVVAGAKYYVFATGSQAPGKTPSKSLFRYVSAYAAVSAAVTVDITAAWTALFGLPTMGKTVWAAVASVNTTTGALTAPVKVFAVTT